MRNDIVESLQVPGIKNPAIIPWVEEHLEKKPKKEKKETTKTA